MKKMLKLLVYLSVMLALLVFFLPKVNLYYAAEELMQKQNVYISDEEARDNGFSLELLNASVFFDKLSLMNVGEVKISPWLVYNTVSLKMIDVNEGFSDFLPQDINFLQAQYVFYQPTHIQLKGESSDSFLYGDVDLINRVVSVHLRVGAQSQKRYKKLLQKLKKEEGGYYYEYKF